MIQLDNIDLRTDATARSFIKDEIVQVTFAKTHGELISREGPNTFDAGDALITGSTGDRWSVSRMRFELKYQPLATGRMGEDGPYRSRPVPVLGKQMHEAFSIPRCAGGDVLKGLVNDWLLQYAPGDYGVVENARFQEVYRPLNA